jgi:hypothetical protein
VYLSKKAGQDEQDLQDGEQWTTCSSESLHQDISIDHPMCDRKPDSLEKLSRLAWVLSTHHSQQLRNGAEALEMARKARGLAQSGDKKNIVSLIDSLLAAFRSGHAFREPVPTQAQ